MITLVQLEYIVAVDTYRHFARAAEKCFVTQPTLSMQIRKLEDFLNIRIFDRTKQPVVPTDIGRQMIEQARRVLAEAGRLDELVKLYQGDLSGQLRIGIIPTLGPYLLPLFAGLFKKRFPAVTLSIEELITENIAERLRTDQLDAGIFVTPYGEAGIIEQPLFYEELLVFAHVDHPFLQHDRVEVADLNQPDIWLLSDGHCFRNQVINLCSVLPGQRQELPFELQGGSLETLMRIIRREGGFTIIPELAAAELINEHPRRVLKFADKTPVRQVSLCYSRNYVKYNLLQRLAETIIQSVPPQMCDATRGELVAWR